MDEWTTDADGRLVHPCARGGIYMLRRERSRWRLYTIIDGEQRLRDSYNTKTRAMEHVSECYKNAMMSQLQSN